MQLLCKHPFRATLTLWLNPGIVAGITYNQRVMKNLIRLLLAFLLLASSLPATAQGVTTSAIKGLVLDLKGQPLPGATVIATHLPSGTTYGNATRDNGQFDLLNMRIGGPYEIKVSFVGYETYVQNNVQLVLGKTFETRITLKEGEGQKLDEVVVKGNRDGQINPDRTGAVTNISSTAIRTLPTISRSQEDFTRLTPQASGQSFGGRNTLYNNFSLDGSIFNNSFGLDSPTPGGQTNSQPVSIDAIEQIQVSLAPYDVRQGGFTGAGINAVTKSGTNEVKVSFVGYETYVQNNVQLVLGKTFETRITLSEGTGQKLDEVLVRGNRDGQINPDRTGAVTNISATAIRTLPTISRSQEDFTRLTPQASGQSFGGRNTLYNNFSLDGSIFNNSFGLDSPTPGGQTNSQPVSLDAIEQIQVSLAPYDVRQGGFTGAGINAVTKSGTNAIKGTAYTYFRNESLIGKKVEGATIENPSLKFNQTGFALGGPLVKNKLFFFTNAELTS